MKANHLFFIFQNQIKVKKEMRTVTKKLVTLVLTALMVVGSMTTACTAIVYGLQPTDVGNGFYFAIFSSDIALTG